MSVASFRVIASTLLLPSAVVILISILNWLAITFDLLSPESLERAVEWRAFTSRFLCSLCLLMWLQGYTEKQKNQSYQVEVTLLALPGVFFKRMCQLPWYTNGSQNPISMSNGARFYLKNHVLVVWSTALHYVRMTYEAFWHYLQRLAPPSKLELNTKRATHNSENRTTSQERDFEFRCSECNASRQMLIYSDRNNNQSRNWDKRRLSLPILLRNGAAEGPTTECSGNELEKMSLNETPFMSNRSQYDTSNQTTSNIPSVTASMIKTAKKTAAERAAAETAAAEKAAAEKAAAEKAAAETAAAEKAAAEKAAAEKAAAETAAAEKVAAEKAAAETAAAEKAVAEKVAAEKAAAERCDQFKSRTTTVMIRSTRPRCPNEAEQIDIEAVDRYRIRARAVPSNPSVPPDSALPWENYAFDRVFGTTATNADIFDEIKPILQELRDPQGNTICIGVDGFSGGGKSFTSYTQETSILSNVGKLLLGTPDPNTRVVFEAVQTPGLSVDSLDLDVSTLGIANLRKLKNPPIALNLHSLFKQHRPCYLVADLTTFDLLVKETIKFRKETHTTNNATSSRTHLAIILYVTSKRHTSTFCLFDLAGNERFDALDNVDLQSKTESGSTAAVNASRLNIHTTLRATIEGKPWVSNSTAIGTLIKALLGRPSAILFMIFHISVFTSYAGAVRTTLSEAERYKRKRNKRLALEKVIHSLETCAKGKVAQSGASR